MIQEQLVKTNKNKILIVDDTDETIRFLAEILNADGYSVTQASSGEQALQSIKSQLPDIILLDVMMPEIDGFEVCRQIKADPETCTIPVIFISALVDEQSKVKGFELGAVDYITKPFRKVEILSRVKIHIGAAQMRAQLERQTLDLQIANKQLQTEITKRKQAEAAMEKQIVALTQPLEQGSDIPFEELFSLPEIQKLQDQFADAFGVASIITRPDGTPITRPSNFCRLCNDIIRGTELGLKNCMHSDAVLGKHNPNNPVIQPCLSGGLWDAGSSITVGGLHVANWLIGQVRNNSQNEQDLKEYARKIGANEQEFMQAHSEVTVMSEEQFRKVSEVLFTMSGQISQMAYQNVQQARFINDRKRIELALQESEERFRTTLYSIGDGVITTDHEGRIRLMNPLAEKLTGWKQQESVGKPLEEVFRIINEQSRKKVEIPVRKVLREGLVVGLANHTLLIEKDGNEIPIADSGAPIRNEKGEIVGVVLVFRDQTEERRAERALRESEEKFRNIIESSPIGMYIYQLEEDGNLIFRGANPSADRIIGIDHHTLMGKTIQQAFPNLSKTEIPEMYVRIAKGELGTQSFEIGYSENQINGFFQVTVFKIGNNSIAVDFLDISDRKKTELALQESEFFFRESQRAASIGSYNLSLATGLWTSSEVLDQIFGMDKDYIRSVDGWENLIYPEDQEMMDHHFKVEVVGQQKPFDKEYRIIRKSDGAVRWVSGLGQLIFDDQGNMVSMIGTIQDITERKLSEAALIENEERFRNLFENAAVGISMTGVDGTIKTNKTFSQILGYTPEEFQNKNWKEITHPDDIQGSINVVNSLMQGMEDRIRFEKRYLHKNGNIVLTDVSTTLHRDINNNPQYFITSINDITKRKEAEENLRLNEQKFRALIENSSDAISLVDSNGLEFYHSSSCQQILGYSDEERNGKSMMELIHPDDLGPLMDLFGKLLQQPGKEDVPPTRIRHLDGSWRWIEGIANNLLADPDIQAIVINFRDITARKQVEDQLRVSERQYRTLFEQASDGIFIADQQGNYVDVNSYGCDMLGYTREELLKLKIKDIIGREEEAKDPIRYKEMRENPVVTAERKLKRKDGSLLAVEISGKMLDDGRVQGIVRDITERKLAEFQLQRSERELKKAQQITHIGSWYLNLANNEVHWSEELYKMYGFDPNLPVPPYTEHMKLFTPESWELLSTSLANTAETGIPYELELKTVREDGSNGWMWVLGETVKDSAGKIVGLWGAAQDISNRKQAEQMLHESEERFRTLVASSSDGISLTDLQGNILFVNERKVEMVKANSSNDLVGLSAFTLLTPFYQEVMRSSANQFVENGYLRDIEAEVICFDGTTFWADFNFTLVNDSQGKPLYIMDSMRDITERKQAERAILEEKNLLRTLINNLPVTVYVKDINARKIAANTLDLATIGILDETAVVGKTDLELFDNEIGLRGYEDDLNVIRTGKPVLNREEYFFSDKGVKHWLLTSKMPLLDANGKPTGLVGIGRDITEQKNSELQIQKLTESIEQSPSTIVITDIYGTIEYVNPKFSDITGYTKEEAIGQNPRILKSGEMPDEVHRQLWEIISSGKVWRGELLNRKKNGELYWEWATITSIKNELGVITNYIAIKEDISLRKQMEVDLIIAKEHAEESDRLKTAFLANMSHEVRTPLNSIIGFSELLQDADFNAEQKNEFVGQIISNGNNLLNIISDIVDISKIEAGEVSIRKSKVHVKDLLDEIMLAHAVKAERKMIRLERSSLCSDSENDIFVFADKERLHQVFNNLISNALKFTAEGSIQLSCKHSGDQIEFCVSDTGIGIPPEFHEIIFDRFRQVEASYTRKYGGNGLGLAITKNLIELMGGEIRVESEVGKGSSFYFTLPGIN